MVSKLPTYKFLDMALGRYDDIAKICTVRNCWRFGNKEPEVL